MKTAWLYLASAGTSLLGNSVAMVVWPWLVLQRTGDPAAAGVVATAIAVPSLLFAFYGGHLIDRVGRKPMSVISDVISGLSVVALIAVDTWAGLNLGWFILIGILGAIGDVPGMAARAALAGDVAYTSGKSLDMLSGINQTLMGIAMFLGPSLAGILLANLPINQVLWITAGCSLLAALLTALMRLTKDPGAEVIEEDSSIKAWLTVLRIPVIRLLAVALAISAVLVTPYLMLLVPAHFQAIDNPTMMGFVHSAYAVGMIIGGSIIAAIGSDNRRMVWFSTMMLFTLGFICLGFLQYSWIVLLGMAVAGVAGGIVGPLQMIVVTESIADNLRGRAFSLFSAIGQMASPVGFAITTILLTQVSIYTMAVILAVAWVLASIYLALQGKLFAEPA